MGCAFHISYSSNHDPNDEHKMRILIPLSEPVEGIDEHHLLANWVEETFPEADHKVRTDVARGIIRSNPKYAASTVYNMKAKPLYVPRLLDEAYMKTVVSRARENHRPLMKTPSIVGREFYFSMQTTLYTDKREAITVEDLMATLEQDEKIPIYCPVCGFDTDLRSEKNIDLLKQNALFKIGTNGIPYINCQSCGSRKDGQDGRGSYFLERDEQRELVQKQQDFFVFRDIRSDSYVAAQKSELTGEVVFNNIAAYNIKNFYWNMARLGEVDVKTIPQAEWVLDFSSDVLVDWNRKFINKYRPPKLWGEYYVLKDTLRHNDMPNYTYKLLKHIAGNDIDMLNAFLDWLAYIIQYRKKTYVTFLFQGVQGTGKDFFYTHIARPIFGERYCANFDQARLRSNFNSVFEDNVFLVLNEVQTDFTSADANLVAARIKTIISNADAEVERKGIDMKHGQNNVNIVLFSNQPNAVRLEQGDRRVNVCPRQEVKLEKMDWLPVPYQPSSLESAIASERIQLFHHLRTRVLKPGVEKHLILNKAKQVLMGLTVAFNEEFFAKFKEGPKEFWDWLLLNYNPGDPYIDNQIAIADPTKPFTVTQLRHLFTNVLKGEEKWHKTTAQKFNKLLAANGLKVHRTHKNNVLDFYVGV